MLSPLSSGENSGSEGEGTHSGLHGQRLGEPVLKFKCLVQLKSRAGLETQDGFFQQRGEGLAAHTPLWGWRPGPDQRRSYGTASIHPSPGPRSLPSALGSHSFYSSLSHSLKRQEVV